MNPNNQNQQPSSIPNNTVKAPPVPIGATMQSSPAPQGKPGKVNTNSTQNVLQIAEIRDGLVIMMDGSFRSVVMVKSINFDLMSPQEQEAVEFSYQGFLNSLYFPIQIFMRSQQIDIKPYLEKLDERRKQHDNMLLATLMDDYMGYIQNLSEHSNIMDKNFYVVIPFFPKEEEKKAINESKNFLSGITNIFKPSESKVVITEFDLENAKTELRNRVQAVLNGLLTCGVKGLPLDTQELIELYYDSYNPDTATRQKLKDLSGVSTDVITRAGGQAPAAPEPTGGTQ